MIENLRHCLFPVTEQEWCMPDCSSWAAWITLSLLTTVSPMTYHRNSQPPHVTSQRGEPQAAPHHITNLTFLPAQSKWDEELMAKFPSLEESDTMWNMVSYGTRPKSAGPFVPTPPFSIFNVKFGRFDSQTFSDMFNWIFGFSLCKSWGRLGPVPIILRAHACSWSSVHILTFQLWMYVNP